MSREYWFVIIAAVLYGAITPGGQFFSDIGLSLFEISVYRVLFISLIILPVVLIKREHLIRREMLSFFVIYGLIGALLELAQFGGIVLGIPVAIVILLIYSQPIWTILFARIMLNESITLRKIISAVIALSGVILLLKSWEIKSVDSALGIICSLLGGIILSLWVIWGRKSGINRQHYLTTTIGWSGFSVVWLLLLWPIAGLFIHKPGIIRFSGEPPLAYWPQFLLFGCIAGVIPHLLFYRGMQKIHASIAGIILLLEPVSATVIAAILFSQSIDINIVAGGVLILLSNYLVIGKPG
jgi:drug/metabolite transporter (DMT)-like permease